MEIFVNISYIAELIDIDLFLDIYHKVRSKQEKVHRQKITVFLDHYLQNLSQFFAKWTIAKYYCNVRGTIIDSKEKINDIDYSVFCKSAAVFWIYISSKIGVCTLYLSDSLSIQLTQCRLWLDSASSLLRHSMNIAILVRVRVEANDLATPRHTIDWWGTESFIIVA